MVGVKGQTHVVGGPSGKLRKIEETELPADCWDRRDEKEIRDLIILAYWPMLTRVVGRLRQGLPPHVRIEEEDLRSYGLIGMYKALDRYDPSVGAFDKFASNFVRGAVLDELRSSDWAPRSLRKRQKDMEKGRTELINDLGRKPTDEELADHLDCDVADLAETRRLVDRSHMRSLDEIRGEAEKDLYAVIPDTNGSPEQYVLGQHDSHEGDRSTLIMEKMAKYIADLPVQRQAVLVMCYYLNLRQSNVAAILGIPESRVSSLHLSAMAEFHDEMEALLLGA